MMKELEVYSKTNSLQIDCRKLKVLAVLNLCAAIKAGVYNPFTYMHTNPPQTHNII